jgi:cytochrome c oxidase accessory protein FixG
MKQIYTIDIKGKYRTIKDILILLLFSIYFFSSWVRYDRGALISNQAIFIDLPKRHIFFFGIQIWPDEMYFVAAFLIMAALGLFFFTSLFGRLWCGYTCPHTVFTDIFLKIEYFFQGDRNQRIILDKQLLDKSKFFKKLNTHIAWLFVSFLFAFGWVSYFYDPFSLLKDLYLFDVTFSAKAWLYSLTFSTYFFAGFLREKVCIYMCPYGRFQSAMIEKSTSVVTYDNKRGELRGKSENSGDCIDCNKCVIVCPMGIDIRDGLQMECIGCGLCIDACDGVMSKLKRKLGLIAYSSECKIKIPKHKNLLIYKMLKPKNILFMIIFWIALVFIIYKLITKEDLNFAIIKERAPLFTVTPDGKVRNSYNIKFHNKSVFLKTYTLSITGLNNYDIWLQNEQKFKDQKFEFKLNPEAEEEFRLFIKTDRIDVHEKTIYFTIKDLSNEMVYRKNSVFIFD